MIAAIVDILIAAVTIGLFMAVAQLAWRPLKRRYLDPPITPGDPALLGRLGGLTCGGCLWFAVFVPLALGACWLMNAAMAAI